MARKPPLGHLAAALAGFAVGLVYHLIGKPVDAGNNLLIDEIHDPKKTVPLHMVPLVLAGSGFVAVFAGADNTPLATIVMAMELFGPDIAPICRDCLYRQLSGSRRRGGWHQLCRCSRVNPLPQCPLQDASRLWVVSGSTQ